MNYDKNKKVKKWTVIELEDRNKEKQDIYGLPYRELPQRWRYEILGCWHISAEQFFNETYEGRWHEVREYLRENI